MVLEHQKGHNGNFGSVIDMAELNLLKKQIDRIAVKSIKKLVQL
jgi:hypothetical protein